MIHIAIGTKAQFIKMIPVMLGLQEKDIAFNLIDLGQHSLITGELREEFKIKEPDVYLSKGRNISRLSSAFFWIIKIFLKSLSGRWVRKNVFLNKGGVCLIHGDTASTLVSLYLAKRAGLKVAHVEAGLRSFCWHEPFPEEILRVITMRFSDVLFAPSQWAFDNLAKMGLAEKSVKLCANTGRQTTFISLSKPVDLGIDFDKFCMITFHRMENIFSRRRLFLIIGIIEEIAKIIPVVFVQHAPTLHRLKKTGLDKRLAEIENLRYYKILKHSQFIHLLDKSAFVMTDGGSIQEECFYLGKPCLLLRRHTERAEGLGENALLSNLDLSLMRYFITHYFEFNRQPSLAAAQGLASEEIIASLKVYF